MKKIGFPKGRYDPIFRIKFYIKIVSKPKHGIMVQ